MDIYEEEVSNLARTASNGNATEQTTTTNNNATEYSYQRPTHVVADAVNAVKQALPADHPYVPPLHKMQQGAVSHMVVRRMVDDLFQETG